MQRRADGVAGDAKLPPSALPGSRRAGTSRPDETRGSPDETRGSCGRWAWRGRTVSRGDGVSRPLPDVARERWLDALARGGWTPGPGDSCSGGDVGGGHADVDVSGGRGGER